MVFKPQTQDHDHDRTERILQAEEQVLERVEEESNISTHRLAAEVGVLQFVVHRTLKEQCLHPKNVQNSHNTHIWSDENPHTHQEDRFQRRFS